MTIEFSPTEVLDSRGPGWKNWVIDNIKRNCSIPDMHRQMYQNGAWSKEEAAGALDYALAISGIQKNWRVYLPTIKEGNFVTINNQTIKICCRVDKPKAVLLDNLLTTEECSLLIEQAVAKGLNRSTVVDNVTGAGVENIARTSTSVYFSRSENELLKTIERRICNLTGWAIEQGEGIQVLQYEPGQEYKPHFDWFDPNVSGTAKYLTNGGQRVGTTVIYLSTAEEGGSTRFPNSGVSFTPAQGGAVFFNSVNELGEPDQLSLHAATPVITGSKIVAVYWQREKAF